MGETVKLMHFRKNSFREGDNVQATKKAYWVYIRKSVENGKLAYCGNESSKNNLKTRKFLFATNLKCLQSFWLQGCFLSPYLVKVAKVDCLIYKTKKRTLQRRFLLAKTTVCLHRQERKL